MIVEANIILSHVSLACCTISQIPKNKALMLRAFIAKGTRPGSSNNAKKATINIYIGEVSPDVISPGLNSKKLPAKKFRAKTMWISGSPPQFPEYAIKL